MDWQQICALAIVAAAFLWLLRTQIFPRGKKVGCGGCGGCAGTPPVSPELIKADELSVLTSSSSRRGGEG